MPQVLTTYTDPAELFEDFDMTFQIAMIGRDGIVIASDRLIVERGLAGFMARKAPIQKQIASKFHVSNDDSVICFYAGGPYAETIARRIVTCCCPLQLGDVEWRNRIESVTKGVTEYTENIVDEIFVCRTDKVSVLKMIRQRDEDPTFTDVNEYICAGIDSYARAIPGMLWTSDLVLQQLSNLACVAIDYAHEEHPELVGGGADIVAINKQGCVEKTHYTQEELSTIRQQFAETVRGALL